MNLEFSDEEQALKAQLRRFLKDNSPPSRVRSVLEGNQAASRELTAKLAELGWLSATIPEIYGGQGLGYKTLCGISEELGRALAPTAFGSSLFLVAEALLLFGTEHQKKAHLPLLASGAKMGAFALAEKEGPVSPRSIATVVRNGRLTGTKIGVIDGADADIALVAARDGNDVRLFIVNLSSDGVERLPQKAIDPTRPLAQIRFSGVVAEPLGGGAGMSWGAIERLLDRAAVLFAFEQLGSADAALEMAREYALTRHAFGRPIGAFQAIKHKLADVWIANELARANAYYAAWALTQDAEELKLAAASARVASTEAFERAARELIQTHGGIAVTWAHDCHLYYRRARHLGGCIGTIHQWRDRLAGSLTAHYATKPKELAEFDDTPADAAFRAEVRAWLSANTPRYIWPKNHTAADRLRLGRGWMAAKAAAGYAGITVPKDLGGRGGSQIEDVIFREEEAKFMGSSTDDHLNLGEGNAIPMMRVHAGPQWLKKLVPPSLSGEVLWAQLFSEPAGGSDLAGIRTRAVRDGDEWVVNGQKIWSSGAHLADWGMLLARTDPTVPKHQGLTYFLIDMRSPGVEVRPLKQISGRSEFNEVFLTDVRIPDAQRLGDVNGGWRVAITTLMNERLALAGDGSVCRHVIAELLRIAATTEGVTGAKLIDETAFRDKVASYHVAAAGMQHIGVRIRTALAKGGVPGPEATIGKVTMTRWLQEMCGYAMDMAGPAGEVIDSDLRPDLAYIQEVYFLVVGYRMGGGTEEIAKNIISERVLGMPQDLRPDKNVPFNKIPS